MNKGTTKLHTIAVNVRAVEDTYSAMPVRMLKTVADLDNIPVFVATTETGGVHLRYVEGKCVRMIHPERVKGLCSRNANVSDAILVDMPVDPDGLEQSGALIDALRLEARASGVQCRVFMTAKGTLSRWPASDVGGIVIGRGLALPISDEWTCIGFAPVT